MLFDYKIICLGNQGAGKTSLLKRCRDSNIHESINNFDENISPTLGLDYISLKFEVYSETVKLQIWDTAGQSRFAPLNKAYFQGSLGAILVISTQ
jgi:small GTP-binding protein